MSTLFEPPKLSDLFTYKCKVRSIYDGDTIRVDVDLGFGHVWEGHNGKGVALRLLGIDTPEIKGKTEDERQRAAAARDFAANLIPVGSEVLVRTHRDGTDKYGRYLAVITNAAGVCVNSEMLAAGHAKEFFPS
jgi:micrococcal nuclease